MSWRVPILCSLSLCILQSLLVQYYNRYLSKCVCAVLYNLSRYQRYFTIVKWKCKKKCGEILGQESLRGPKLITRFVGEHATFKWNTTGRVKNRVSWGVQTDSNATTGFIAVMASSGIIYVNQNVPSYRRRLTFVGSIDKGHLWFKLQWLTMSDTNWYFIKVHKQGSLFPSIYYTKLTVLQGENC